MIDRVRVKSLQLLIFLLIGSPLCFAGQNVPPATGRPQNCSVFLKQLNFTEVRPEVFYGVVSTLKDKPFLRKRSVEEYADIFGRGGRLFLSQNHLLGYGITKEGLLISVFNASHTPGLGAFGVFSAIDNEAKALVCVDGPLRAFYESCGFRVDHSFEMQPENAGYDYDWPKGIRPQMLYMTLSP